MDAFLQSREMAPSTHPARSLFTDFGDDAIGVPRNRAIPANRDPRRFDEGLCATGRAQGWQEPGQWCGDFRTPSLRNVAARERYMHDGVFSDLRDAVAFYATRSIEPGRWYRNGRQFDDADIDAIVAFPRTLADAPFEASAAAQGAGVYSARKEDKR